VVAAAQARPVGENRTHDVRAATRTLIARTSAYVIVRQRTSAYVSVRQRTSAYVSIRQRTSAYASMCVFIAFAGRTLRASSSAAVGSSALVSSSLDYVVVA
jgi:hypothetical protein